MKVTYKNSKTQKFQMGGQMNPETPEEGVEQTPPAEEPTEQGNQEQDPMMMLAQMAAQALQSQDCNAAMQVCQAFLEIVQQIQGGAPEEPQGEPVFARNGAKLNIVRRIKK